MTHASKQEKRAYLALVAVVIAMGVLSVVVVTVATLSMQLKEAEAQGCRTSIAFNASKGRCFRG